MVAWRWVTPDYFKALNIPIVRGQGFTEEQRNRTRIADLEQPAGDAIVRG
jgi:hypothetical protein